MVRSWSLSLSTTAFLGVSIGTSPDAALHPSRATAARTDQSNLIPPCPAPPRASLELDRHPIAFIEKRGLYIRLAGVGKAVVPPAGAPAIPENEAVLLRVTDDTNRMSAAHGVGLEGIEVAVGCRSVVPGGV